MLGDFECVADVTGSAGLVPFSDLEGVLGRLLDALALPVAPGREEGGQQLCGDLAAGGAQRLSLICTVTVKEIRSGSVPPCSAARVYSAHSAW